MTNKTFSIGVNLETAAPFEIPIRGVATKTIAVVGKRGTGKTWTVGVWVEKLLTQKIPVVVIDPIGHWYGLGISADGASPGFPIAVFGGKRGQVELTADMGGAIARYVSSRHVPTVIDLSLLSKTAWRRVTADFCDELFRVNELPIVVVVEETPEFLPQRIMGDNAVVYGAMDRVVRLGRNHGIGMLLIGQRLQTINKDTLSQADALCLMRIVDPQGKKAALDWIREKDDDAIAEEIVGSLSKLPTGTAYVWSPEWLETLTQVKIGARTTFHYDPDRALEQGTAISGIAQAVDTESLVREFSKFVSTPTKEAKDAKPDVASKKRISELEAQIDSLNAAVVASEANAISDDEIQKRVASAVENATAEMRSRLAQFEGFVSTMVKQGGTLVNGDAGTIASQSVLSHGIAAPQKVKEYIAKQSAIFNSKTVTVILQTLAENYTRFLQGMSDDEIATEAGYDPRGGRYQGTLRQLVKRRVIVREGERFLLNPAHLK